MLESVKIKNIREVRWEYSDILYLENIEFDIKKIVSDINFVHTEYEELNLIEFFFHSRYSVEIGKKSDRKQIFHSDVEIDFEFDDFQKNFRDLKDKDKLSLIVLLLDITISTVRGILHSNTKGHTINRLPLPIINPIELMEEHIKQQQLEDEIKEVDNKNS